MSDPNRWFHLGGGAGWINLASGVRIRDEDMPDELKPERTER